MSIQFELKANLRNETGKGHARRMRKQNRVPGIIYGGSGTPTAITVDHNDLAKSLAHEAFYSHILTITVDGKPEKAVLKALHRHPAEPRILHLDLLRVSETSKIRVHVPLHFTGEAIAPGVKTGGGIVSHLMNNVEVSCLPKDLPEFIEVDLSALNVGESVHLSNLPLSAGVELVQLAHGHEHDLAVATIIIPRGAVEAEATAAAAAATPAA